MKKTLLSLIALFIWVIAFASVKIDGIYYNLNYDTKTAEVTYERRQNMYNYSNITTITIPSSITYNNENYNVTSIGDYAFCACEALISVTIPNSITSIGECVFLNSTLTDIYVDLNNNNFTSIDGILYNKDTTSIILCPETKTSITIPNTITSIRNKAFLKCVYLTYIKIPDSVTSIGKEAFYGCSGLTSIEIPNSVTSIGEEAFYGCSGLTSIEIPNSVTSIGNYPFLQCSSLININVDLNNNYFSSIDGILYDKNITTLICCPNSKTNILIPNSTITIKDGAFAYCSLLDSIEIPNSVTSIEHSTFLNCSSLTSITIPNSVTSIGGYAFYNCSSLTSIIIPNNITSIEDYTFYSCSSLTSITIPDSIISIGKDAFMNCSSLTAIKIPKSVTFIGERAFSNCPSLTSIKYYAEDYNYSNILFKFDIIDRTNLTELACPATWLNEFNETTQYAFTNQLTEITITEGEITENIFNFINRSKKSLITINLAGATNTIINDLAFYDCYKLENITLPANTEIIGYKAFAECVHIKQLEIPATVTNIEERAFENCRSIASLTFAEGSNLKTIGAWAFYNNHNITEVTIPEGVEEIGDAAFYGCNYIENITLPTSVQSIGDNGFALCNQVKRIEVKSTTPPAIEAKTFFQVSRDIEFFVPEEARKAYEEHKYWKEFIQKIPTNVENSINDVDIFTIEGTLHIAGVETDYQVRTVTGQLVYSGNATTLSLPRGIYLVIVAGKTEKVAL